MSYYGTEREIIENLEKELAAAIEQRDKAIKFLQCYRHEILLGHRRMVLAHKVDLLLKECGK